MGIHGTRSRARFAAAFTSVVALGLSTVYLAGAGSAHADTSTATITVHAGGIRTAASTVSGLQGATYQAVGGGNTYTCTTDSSGACSMTVPSGSGYTITEVSAPAGWYTNPKLDYGDAYSGTSTAYSFVTSKLKAGDSIDVPGANYSADNGNQGYPDSSKASGHTFTGLLSNSLNDPSASQSCGLNIALILDQSGSMSQDGKQANLKSAAKDVITALTGTPSQMAIYTFAAAPDSAGHVGLTSLATAAGATTLTNFVTNLKTPANGTNWDQGIYQAVTTSKTYDLVVVLTDGNPTTDHNGVGGNNTTYFHNVDNGIFSANALKALGTRVVALGIGVSGGAENLRAISGPTKDSDYFTGTATDFGATLKQLATGNCQNVITVTKQIQDYQGNLLPNSAAANGWNFAGQVSSGSTIGTFPATANKNGTNGVTQATLAIPSNATPTITVTETLQGGYTFAGATCLVNGKTPTGQQSVANGVQFTGAANVPISCTFTNKQPPPAAHLTLVKQVKDPSGNVVTNADVSPWTLTAGGSGGFSGTANTAAVTNKPVTGGVTYTLSENTVAGYTNGTSWSCVKNSGGGKLTATETTVTPAAGQDITCTITNAQKATVLTVQKTDDSGTPLSGATFELRSGSANGPVLDSCSTAGANGTCTVSKVPFGSYWWVEKTAPAGYGLPANASRGPIAVDANNAGGSFTTVVFKDPQLPTTLSVKKVDAANTGTVLSGAEFTLYNAANNIGVGTCQTVASGLCSVGNLPFGTYYWAETQAPTGYVLPASPTSANITINAGNAGSAITPVVFADPHKLSTLTVKKTDATTGAALDGATFALHKDTAGGSVVGSCTTSGGSCSIPGVDFGSYVWVETGAPEGYVLPDPAATKAVSVSASNAGNVAAVTFEDQQVPSSLTVKKTDAATGAVLAGAAFELRSGSADGSAIDSCTTGEAGTCAIGNLPFGTYYWVETAAPAGYNLPSPASFGPIVIDAHHAGKAFAATVVADVRTVIALDLVKSAVVNGGPGKSYDRVGDKVTYSFLVTNSGTVTVSDIQVAETAFSGTGTAPVVSCPADTSLDPGDSVTCTATDYAITQADLDAGSVTNSARASGTGPNEQPVDSNESSATVDGKQSPALALVKSALVNTGVAGVPYTKAGDVVHYSFLVTNTGNVTVTGVAVTETAFTGSGSVSAVSCPAEAAALAPGASVTCTATYTITQSDLDAGKVDNAAKASGTDPADDPVASDPSSVTVHGAAIEAETIGPNPASPPATPGSTSTRPLASTGVVALGSTVWLGAGGLLLGFAMVLLASLGGRRRRS